MRKLLPLLGRVLLSAIFIKTGIGHLVNFGSVYPRLADHGIPLAALFLAGSLLLRIGGGISLILGYEAKWGAWAIIAFLLPTTLIFHTQFSNGAQLTQFLKNIGLMGGLLMIAYYGPGPISIDNRSKP
jgi:putative oxidoreductase